MAKCNHRALYVAHIRLGFDLYLCEGHAAYMAGAGKFKRHGITVVQAAIVNPTAQCMCMVEGSVNELILKQGG